MQTQIEIPLSKLKRDPANVRKTDVAPSPRFVASVREHGILEPLTVRPNGEAYYAMGGGKRLAALAVLLKEKAISPEHPVPCIVREVEGKDARDIGLTLNYMREDMHPVDEYEAFADMIKDGMSPEEIGKKYGLKKKEVDQVLALGNLAPEIRNAWREEKLDEKAARAFTLEPDQNRQTDIFNSLRKRGGFNDWTVRSAIVGNAHEAKAMMDFVGVAVYRQAGGAITQDLFADAKESAEIATDLKLLKKLYDDKLKIKVEEVKAEGWRWVEFQSDLPYNAQWWESKPKSSIKAEERGNYGVIFSKGHHGDINIKFGVVKPVQQKAEKRKAAAKAGGTPVMLPAALCGRLTDQITKATASVLETDGSLALAAICAALTSAGFDNAFNVSSGARGAAKFVQQFELMRKKNTADLCAVLAKVAAQSLAIGASVQDKLPLSKNRLGDRALLEALNAKKLNAALRAGFDAPDYFRGVTAQACKDAILLCDPKYPFTGKEKKSDLAKLAANLVKKSNAGDKAGYLPPEMRTAHYDGPSADPKKAVKKKAAKK